MNTDIYKLKSIPNAYLFVVSGSDLSEIPQSVLKKIGDVAYFKSITLIPDTQLIAADSNEVINNINTHGYHIQGAQVKSDVSEVGAAVGGGILAASIGLGPLGAIAGAAIGIWLASQSKTEEED